MFKFLKGRQKIKTHRLDQKDIDKLQDTEGFSDVTETAVSSADIGPYVKAVPKSHYAGIQLMGPYAVEHVYRTHESTFDLVHIKTDSENVFLVLAVDLLRHEIIGHYILDLNKLYGLGAVH